MKGVRAIKTIISGGQTGVDRAALDFAIERGIETGGFVPKGRLAEDGPLPETYRNLTETDSADPAERTRLNVETSDATLIISRGGLFGGSALTRQIAQSAGKPFLHVDLAASTIEDAVNEASEWLVGVNCERLNVAGPRASEDGEVDDLTRRFLRELFK